MTDQTAAGLAASYLAWLHVRRDSPVTIRTRRYLLARVQREIPVRLDVATAADLEAWLTARVGTIADATLRAELSGLRAFYRWLLDHDLRDDDPTKHLPMPRAPRRVPKPMPERDVARALDAADDRMRAILALAAMAGLRACEIARLDWSEIDDGEHPRITVAEGKGGHSRTIPIPRELVHILAALPNRRGPVVRRLDGAAGHCLPHNISHQANDHLHELGIAHTLHTLRHRAGTIAYRATRDPFAVRDLLGHTTTTMTALYAAADGQSVRACADALGKVAS